MSITINNRSLKISNYIFEKLGCSALSPKVYISKNDDLDVYIKAKSMIIDNINDFVAPKLKSLEQKEENINYNSFFNSIKSNNEIRVNPPLTINPLLGEEMVVTILNGNIWYEFICRNVKIEKSSKSYAKIYISEYIPTAKYGIVHQSAKKGLSLSTQLEEIYTQKGSFYRYFIMIPTDLIYSIESKSEIEIPSLQLGEDEHDISWRIGNILLSHMRLIVDYDRKIISGQYYLSRESDGGRRTSNGWENGYSNTTAYFYKTFELIFDIQKFMDELPELIKKLDGTIQYNDNDFPYKRNIIIDYKTPLTINRINEVLQFQVKGTYYKYYE